MKKYLLYMHINKINNKVYVGITNNKERRWRSSGIEYKPSKNNTSKFYNAIQKYGWDNFEHKVIIDGMSFEEALEKEKEMILKFESYKREKGYNISLGGNGGLIYQKHPRGMSGKNQTEFQKQNQKEWASKKENNCMTNGQVIWGKTHNHPKGMKGKKHTEENKLKISETLKEKGICKKKCQLIYPNGDIKNFDSCNELCEHINISVTSKVYLKMKKGPYVVSKFSDKKHLRKDLEGMTIKLTPR